MVTWRRRKVINASQRRGKSMIAPSMRGTMAVHLLINTLIIISLLLNELSALHHHCLKPPPHLFPPLPVFFSFERKRFSHFTFFPPVCLLRSSLPPDPDGPTAAYANGTPFPQHKYQLNRAGCLHILLEIVRR